MRRGLLALAVASAALLSSGCGAVGHTEFSASNAAGGKKIFQQKCASCHTLADADAKGTIGPNLDDAFGCAEQQGFKQSTIRDVIRGQIDYASPPMPQKIVKGDDADTVSDYITKVAGTGVECNAKGSLPEPGHS